MFSVHSSYRHALLERLLMSFSRLDRKILQGVGRIPTQIAEDVDGAASEGSGSRPMIDGNTRMNVM